MKSVIYALIAVASWSTVATAFKITLKYLTHFEMVLVATTTAMIIFAANLCLQRKWKLVGKLTKGEWLYFAILGLLNPLAYYLVLFKSYNLLPAHVAQPINYTWPIVLLIMLSIFNGKKIPASKYIGMVIALCGVGMISMGGYQEGHKLSGYGIALGFLSAILWASYWMVNNRNKNKVDGNVALFMSFLFGTIYMVVASCFVGVNLSSVPGVLAGMYVGGFEMGIPFIFFAMALRTTENPVLINQLTYLSPFLSMFLIAIMLGENIALNSIIGLVLIVGGIVLNEFFFSKKSLKGHQ